MPDLEDALSVCKQAIEELEFAVKYDYIISTATALELLKGLLNANKENTRINPAHA